MVNNAGILLNGPFGEYDEGHWRRALDVNLLGVVHGSQAAYAVMTRQGSGTILNTGSLAGLMVAPRQLPYTVTKQAVVAAAAMARALEPGRRAASRATTWCWPAAGGCAPTSSCSRPATGRAWNRSRGTSGCSASGGCPRRTGGVRPCPGSGSRGSPTRSQACSAICVWTPSASPGASTAGWGRAARTSPTEATRRPAPCARHDPLGGRDGGLGTTSA
ncbi:SDR family NAD(P)-dependent oxidoreductase [Propioniciclava sinopodophylli]|uniref:SDR family NAD(P)-dependent oxidoreductase n=1 Tax=Propioniciclava sinopodophylli TaxID=1837344 RepID=A0A4Q9KEL1_9ACTN|nr:SDR family NAD(P)-dependent oxidoreductase [Propioniciclava sinopodophylli]